MLRKARTIQFSTIELAKQRVKELLPSIGSKRSHDLALALFWELRTEDVNLPEEYMSYERVRNYLENNEYGLATVNRNEMKAGVLGGNLGCLIGISGPHIRSLQPGHLLGVFPRIRNVNKKRGGNSVVHDYESFKLNRFSDTRLFDPMEIQEISYMDRFKSCRRSVTEDWYFSYSSC